MRLDFCPTCGKPLVRITTKTAFYKAVCLDCEMTYKLSGELQGLETIKFKPSSPSQMTEAAMNKQNL